MKLLVASSVLFTASLAHASGSRMEELNERSTVDLAPPVTSCADYNGTWSGTCTVSEPGTARAPTTESFSGTVYQEGCARFRLGNGPLVEVGVATNLSSASPLGHRTEQYTAWWEDNGQTVRSFSEITGFLYASGKYVMSRTEGKVQMLQNGRVSTRSLVTLETGTGSQAKPTQTMLFECELQRVAR
jgi:hypothetical protein